VVKRRTSAPSGLEAFLRDLRLAARSLVRSPVFTLAVVLCLGLGMGAVSTVFSFVYSVILRPLPFAEPERLGMLWHRMGDEEKLPFSGHEMLDYQRASSFEDLAAATGVVFNLSDEEGPERILALRASSRLLPMLGVEPALGRGFREEEDRFGAERVVLLSDGLWRRRYGADPGVLGRIIRLEGQPATIVGVLPRGFLLLGTEADLWVPISINYDRLPPRQARGLLLIGRLRQGVTAPVARQELAALAAGMQQEYPDVYPEGERFGVRFVPLTEELIGSVRRPLLLLQLAVLLVLLIAGVNVINLLLARTSARESELALRLALGAGRIGVVRTLFAESLLLSGLGAGLGLLLTVWAVGVIRPLAPAELPRLGEVGVNGGVFLAAALLALVAGAALTLVPARQIFSGSSVDALRQGGRGSLSGRSSLARSLLVAAEVGLAALLLVGAGLLLRSFSRLGAQDPGFATENRLIAETHLPRDRYRDPAAIRDLYRELTGRLEALPGVRGAAAVSYLPLVPRDVLSALELDGRPWPPGQDGPQVGVRVATPGYHRALGIRLRAGRLLEDGDDDRGLAVALADADLAERLWPGEDPLGKRLRFEPGADPGQPWRTVVGIVEPVRQAGLGAEARGQIYIPHAQRPLPWMALVVWTEGAPEALAGPLRDVVASLDSDLPVSDLSTLAERRRGSLARERFQTWLFTAFGLLALALAAVGVYGVTAYGVTRRFREIGVRIALGASRPRVLGWILGRALGEATLGLAVGLFAALGLGRLMAGLLFGVSSADPLTFAGVACLLLLLVLAAAWIPARRATRIEPATVLRGE